MVGLMEEDSYDFYDDLLVIGWESTYKGGSPQTATRITKRLHKLETLAERTPSTERVAVEHDLSVCSRERVWSMYSIPFLLAVFYSVLVSNAAYLELVFKGLKSAGLRRFVDILSASRHRQTPHVHPLP